MNLSAMFLTLVPLVVFLPVAGLLVNLVFGGRLGEKAVGAIASTASGLAFVVSVLLAYAVWIGNGVTVVVPFADWIQIGALNVPWAFRVDTLSVTMMLVVSGVGTLIHVYAIGYMHEDVRYKNDLGRYRRFFVYLNLFIALMMVLVSGDSYLMLFVGWEGVGLCSYLLIGFWFEKDTLGRASLANAQAAKKAMIANRIGDFGFLLASFTMFWAFKSLTFDTVFAQSAQVAPGVVLAITLFLLIGVTGKSAQLPLYVWLPDAMAGPTPVSALIHAATMVTAGVYLIARMYVVFAMAPAVQLAVAVIGTATLLYAGLSALTQWDIKRVLAYSTISQVGYMFLALGVGAWSAAVFHFVTHACFKALLFLCAGVVIQGLDEEHNMFKMGGLRRLIPGTFWCFLVGAASLSALPIVTAGFYSKDLILMEAWSSQAGGGWLWLAGLAGAFLTSMYAFRMVFLTFFGEAKATFHKRADITMKIPLVILSALSIVTGLIETPRSLGNITFFSDFMESVLPELPARALNAAVEISVPLASVIGLYLAYLLFLRRRGWTERISGTPAGSLLHAYWFSGWGFDWLYDRLIVMPFVRAANWNKEDVIDLGYGAIAWVSTVSSMALALTQTGKIRWYAAAIALGALLFMGIVVLG